MYIIYVDVKNALSVFPTFLARTFFLRFYIRFFLRFFLSFFLRSFLVLSTFFSLVGQHWKAAGLRPPGGLQAGASKAGFLCPNDFSTFLHVFCTFFTVTIPCPPLKQICLQGGRVGGGIENDTVFSTFICSFFLRFLLPFFLRSSLVLSTFF